MRRILVLGATGMLGNAIMSFFAAERGDYSVYGSTRTRASHDRFPAQVRDNLVDGVDVQNTDALLRLFAELKPDVVINCVGIIKQVADTHDVSVMVPINTLLPHRLAKLCELVNARLVHFSTDCVFKGTKGNYTEMDSPDASDLYGRSKLLGEVDFPHAITLRTSIVGRELGSAHGLVDWFLSQEGSVKGFTNAIFSGLPTVELARVVKGLVLPRPAMRGVYHVSSAPISKYDLLRLVAEIYSKDIEIVPNGDLVIDRSLDSARFRAETGYAPPIWRELIVSMREFDHVLKRARADV